MKKITLLFILSLTMISWSYSQCTTQSYQWPDTTVTIAPVPGVQQISANNWPDNEFSVLTGIVPGETYTVTAAMYITVTESDGITIIGHGANSVTFTAGAGITDIICYWTLDAACNGSSGPDTVTAIECTTCVCTATAAPNAVTTPTPADAATGVTIIGTGVTFSWVEDTSGEAVDSFDISIGLTITGDDIGSLAGATSGNTVNFGATSNTTYYWKIDAINCMGTTTSAVWSFTTAVCTETAAPACTTVIAPIDTEPAAATSDDGSGGRSVTFSWDAIAGASGYVFTLDGTALGTVADTTVDITGLDILTSYTWSIAPVNCFGTAIFCTTWSFTTDDGSLSVNDFEQNSFNYFYDKITDVLSLQSDQLAFDNFELYNILGQRVMNTALSQTSETINMSTLKDGIYLAKVTIAGRTQTIKLLKQ
ncbi:hypothetical protein A9Q87_06305 [Flavobacteriales bacterium 34_180_T64]|nr:hypothetical protein A9Q87_06305 [Flavobacteriales bacterium 34_180_T64]